MSGICGIYHFNKKPIHPSELEAMARAAAHRGPDGIHYRYEGPVGLAHLALNVTPESLRERQPLLDSREEITLSADARLDNRDELIRTLSNTKNSIDSRSTDADLILAAYRHWDLECPAHLIGDFAFVLWDSNRRRLFAARDPLAMRPLYYRIESHRLLFASEVKQILSANDVPVRLFEPAIATTLLGESGPLDWTFYEGISQLHQAHALIVENGRLRTWQYWDIDPNETIEYTDEQEYVEHFRDLFELAVEARLRCIKPVGISLSGGLDSGSVAAMAGQLHQQAGSDTAARLRAYCHAYEELPQCDERHISDGIVNHYGLSVTNIPAEQAWPLKDYPQHGPDRDEPLMGAYQALHDRTLETARDDGIGMMLTGARGDAMMGGALFDYLSLLRTRRWRTLWNELRLHSRRDSLSLNRVVRHRLLLPLAASVWNRNRLGGLRKSVRTLLGHDPLQQPAWVLPDFAKRTRVKQILRNRTSRHEIRDLPRRQRYEVTFDPMEIRGEMWNERNHARHQIARSDPWTDRRIVSFVNAIPQRILNRAGEQKRLARRAMRGVMPEAVRRAAGKIYPSPLYRRAVYERERATVLDLISNSRAAAYGFVKESSLREHYEAVCQGAAEHDSFWPTLSVEMWLRQHWN